MRSEWINKGSPRITTTRFSMVFAAFALSASLALATGPDHANSAAYGFAKGAALPPAARADVAGKLDWRLQRLLTGAEDETPQPLSDLLSRRATAPGLRNILATDDGLWLNLRLQDTDADTLRRLRQAGVDIREVYGAYSQALAFVSDTRQLRQMESLADILHIAPPEIALRRAGSVLSRAPVALRADQGRARYGLDGQGQVLGIISDSFALTPGVRNSQTTPAAGEPGMLSHSNPQNSGDLPAQVTLYADSLPPDGALKPSDEGAAMAELAYDIAPGLGFAFHTVGLSRAAFASAIDTLCSGGRASVVVDDVGFAEQNFYQKGIVAQAASRCVANGIPYFSAAGNEGDFAYRYQYRRYEGGEVDVGDRRFHAWDSRQGTAADPLLGVILAPGTEILVILQWNQPNESTSPGNGAQIDLDLYAYTDDELNIHDLSVRPQGSTGNPSGNAAEFVRLTNSSGSPRTFFLAVEHIQGSEQGIPQSPQVPLEFRLIFVGGGISDIVGLEYPPNGPAIWGHPMATGVVSVAAVPWWQAPNFDPSIPPTTDIDPQSFSSRGGDIPLQFDANGQFINQTRRAPTLAAVDGNNNTFFGQDINLGRFNEPDGIPNFFGTSAAAPNAAAVAALLLEFRPALTPAQVRQALVSTTIDVSGSRAEPGEDDVTGAGLIDADAALAWLEQNAGLPGQEPSPAEPQLGVGGGSSGGGGGCFIATAAYGSQLAPELDVLRWFRDEVLESYSMGRHFIAYYYRVSPAIAERISTSPLLQSVTRALLLPVIVTIKQPEAVGGALALLIVGLGFQRRRRRV